MYDFDFSQFTRDDSGELEVIKYEYNKGQYYSKDYCRTNSYLIEVKYKSRHICVEVMVSEEHMQPDHVSVTVGTNKPVNVKPGVSLKKYVNDYVEPSHV